MLKALLLFNVEAIETHRCMMWTLLETHSGTPTPDIAARFRVAPIQQSELRNQVFYFTCVSDDNKSDRS